MKGILFIFGAVLLLLLFLAGALLVAGGRSGRAVSQAAVEIERPAAEVFPWLTEPEKIVQWRAGPETESEIVALEPGRLLAQRLAGPGYAAGARYELEEAGGKTRLRCRVDSRYSGFPRKLLAPALTPRAQWKLEEDLRRLKERVENAR